MKAYLINSLITMGVVDPIALAVNGHLLINGQRFKNIDKNTLVFLSDTLYVHGSPLRIPKKFALHFN